MPREVNVRVVSQREHWYEINRSTLYFHFVPVVGWHDLSKHSEVTEKDFAFIEKVRSIDGVDSIQIDLTEIAIFIEDKTDWGSIEHVRLTNI